MHHFTVTKPKFRSKLPKFRSEKPKFRSECNEISFFEFKTPFRSELPKFSEISPEIPFPPDGGIRSKNEKENPGRPHAAVIPVNERSRGAAPPARSERKRTNPMQSERRAGVEWSGDAKRKASRSGVARRCKGRKEVRSTPCLAFF